MREQRISKKFGMIGLGFLVLVTPCWARPHRKAPKPLDRPKAEVTVKSSNRFFGHHYDYAVLNQSVKPLGSFSLVLETAKLKKCWAPRGWYGKATPVLGSTSVEWTAVGGAEIAPGRRLEGFAVLSPSPEGKAQFLIRDTDLVESRSDTTGPLESIQDKPKEVNDRVVTCKGS